MEKRKQTTQNIPLRKIKTLQSEYFLNACTVMLGGIDNLESSESCTELLRPTHRICHEKNTKPA